MRALRWVASARLISQLVTWGLTALTVRLLQPGDYGIVATSGLFTILATLLLDGGLSAVLISRRDLPREAQGAAAAGTMILSAVLALAIAAAAPAGGAFFHTPALVAVLRIAALQLPIAALTVVPLALLSREMSFRQIALAQTFASIVQGVSTLVLAYVGQHYWSLIYGTLLGGCLRAAAMWLSLDEIPPLNLRLGLLRPLLRSGSHMVGQRLLYFVSGDFDTFLLGRFGGATILGPYSLAKTLAHSPLDQLSGAVNQVTLPAFAAKAGDVRAQINALVVVISSSATLVFPLFWLGGALSPVALPLIFGPRWTAMVFPFIAFTIMLPMRSIYTLLDTAVVGTGRTGATFRNMAVWACVMIPTLFVGAHFGAKGAAVAWVAGFPFVLWSALRRFAGIFETEITTFLRPLMLPATCAAAGCLAVELVQLGLQGTLRPVALLCVELAAGGICYGLCMRRFARGHYDQFMQMGRQLLRR